MITTLARKSLRARWGRNLFIAFAIAFGVSFVSGSFVLADSMRATFDDLFDELAEDLDLQVRTVLEGVGATDDAVRDPVPADVLEAAELPVGEVGQFAELDSLGSVRVIHRADPSRGDGRCCRGRT